MVILVWDRPVLVFYHERRKQPEREPFAVVKARKLMIVESEKGRLSGNIDDFFPIMGTVEMISSDKSTGGKYVICWFDDAAKLFEKSRRKLAGVAFASGLTCQTDKKGKKKYNAIFNAERGKLK